MENSFSLQMLIAFVIRNPLFWAVAATGLLLVLDKRGKGLSWLSKKLGLFQ